MTVGFPVIVCLVGCISSFWVTVKLRNFKVSAKPPASRASLSVEERQQKIRIASWISFAMGCVMLVGAIVLARLAGGIFN
jgi:hypothetical protein